MSSDHRDRGFLITACELPSFGQTAQKTFYQSRILCGKFVRNRHAVPDELHLLADVGDGVPFDRPDLRKIPRRQWRSIGTLLLIKKYRLDPKAFLFIAVRSETRFPAFLSGSVGLLVL